jgi:hypothetical protein
MATRGGMESIYRRRTELNITRSEDERGDLLHPLSFSTIGAIIAQTSGRSFVP